MSDSNERYLALANEYASVRLAVDESGNGPRIRVSTNRDAREIYLDPIAFDLLCHADFAIFDLLADAARDSLALEDFDAIRRQRPILD